MERLNKEEREELRKKIGEYNFHVCDIPRSLYDATPLFFAYQKYCLVSAILQLKEKGIGNDILKMRLPDMAGIYEDYWPMKEEEDYPIEWYERSYELDSEFEHCNDIFLHDILSDTGWKIRFVEELSDYEDLPDGYIEENIEIVSEHWYSMNEAHTVRMQSPYLESKGCKPYTMYGALEIGCNMVLYNSNISKVFMKCKENPEYREMKESKELWSHLLHYDEAGSLRGNTLFINTFPDVSFAIHEDSNQYFESYVFGVYLETGEEIRFSMLNYAAAVNLLLLDMEATELLEQLESMEKEERTS